jgi:hypothetical protein
MPSRMRSRPKTNSSSATPVTETIRDLLLGHPAGQPGGIPLGSALAWCGGIGVVSVALCAILFRRRTAA